MIRVVLDTNVLVSALIKDAGAEARLLDLVSNQHLALFVSEAILAEYEGVLTRPKLRLNPERVQQALAQLRTIATVVEPQQTLSLSPDEPDNRFLEVAAEASADFLVTGNKRHFPKAIGNTEIVNARELLEQLGPTL